MIAKAAAVVIVNFIMYLAFGSFFEIRGGRKWSLPMAVSTGFFAYYALFAVFCLPVMFTYRPLSLLARIWIIPCVLVVAVSFFIYRKAWAAKLREVAGDVKSGPAFWIVIAAITVVSVALAVITYNFTLDAAYYVANVATNVDTDMINVYDAFTGNWQDHFELRYVFATYYANDAVICSLTGIPALVETKIVMSSVVMIIVSLIYCSICRSFYEDHRRALLMYVFMTLISYTFISMYTTSNFLMTRTYEGKSVVGNISVVLIFAIYMMLIRQDTDETGIFIRLFIVCLGTATVSSTANMVIPAEVCVLFIPYAILHKKIPVIPKVILCILPELVMMLIYVLYVKGYFAVYTFPR